MAAFRYERLRRDDAAVLLIDPPSGRVSLVQDLSPGGFENDVLALAALATSFGLSTILTPSFEDGRSDGEARVELLSSPVPVERSLIPSDSVRR